MFGNNGSLVIVFNGEIYNYLELRLELLNKGVSFNTKSDTEVLLASYRVWGEDFLARLNGMFAFAIWDEAKRELFAARDRFGEKPMFIGFGSNKTIAIASEMKAIFAHSIFKISPRQEALGKYGTGSWYEDDRSTFFEGIERIPPAHAMRIGEDGVLKAQWRYWTPNYDDIDEDIRPRIAVEKFRELLDRSVRMRLRADVPIGSSLSGGLDSSAIVGFLSSERAEKNFTQNTFSACFDEDPTLSEAPQIDEVVRHTGVRTFKVFPKASGLEEESLLLHWHQEEPFLSASIYLQWCVARLSYQQNTVVLLDGQGADELLGGYQFYFKAHQLDMLDKRQYGRALWETSLFNRRLRIEARKYAESQRRFNADIAYSVAELFKLAISRPNVWHYPYEIGVVKALPGRRMRRTLGEALQYNCLPMLLRHADRNSMAFSREVRLPFLDYDLVDYCIRLPDHVLARNGWQKWVLRKSAEKLVPPSICWRADKVGYAAPLDLWLRGSLKAWGYERIFSPRIAHVEGYDRNALQKAWDAHQSCAANNSWTIWRWISLSEWFELMDRGWWKEKR
jgi:asparagine synthase (glutamine-hydrolysing)